MWLLIGYLALNRLIPALVTVPVGISIHPSEILLLALVVAVPWAMTLHHRPLPSGLLGFIGLGLVTLLLFGPLVNAGNLTASEVRSFDQGIFLTIGYTALFVAAYQVGAGGLRTVSVVGWVVGVAVFQALIGIYEFMSRAPLAIFNRFWLALGLQVDPRGATSLPSSLSSRLTGELRAYSTAPHPLVLSATLATTMLLTLQWIILERNRRARVVLAVTALIQGLGIAIANSRTGMLILAFGLVVLAILNRRRVESLIKTGLGVLAALPIVAIVSPRTLRLALDLVTFGDADPTAELRISRLPLIMDFLADRTYIGGGYLTHNANTGQLWDNAYLQALTETAILGTAGFIIFFISAAVVSWNSTNRGESPHLTAYVGVFGAVGVLAGGLAFDAWTFDQYLPMCLAIMGLSAGSGQQLSTASQVPLSTQQGDRVGT